MRQRIHTHRLLFEGTQPSAEEIERRVQAELGHDVEIIGYESEEVLRYWLKRSTKLAFIIKVRWRYMNSEEIDVR